jgi:hypothetical protein
MTLTLIHMLIRLFAVTIYDAKQAIKLLLMMRVKLAGQLYDPVIGAWVLDPKEKNVR